MRSLLISRIVLKTWRNSLRLNQDMSLSLGVLALGAIFYLNLKTYQDFSQLDAIPLEAPLLGLYLASAVSSAIFLQWWVPGDVTRSAAALPITRAELSLGLLLPLFLVCGTAPLLLGIGGMWFIAGQMPLSKIILIVSALPAVTLTGVLSAAVVVRLSDAVVGRFLPDHERRRPLTVLVFLLAVGLITLIDAGEFASLLTPVPWFSLALMGEGVVVANVIGAAIGFLYPVALMVAFWRVNARWPLAVRELRAGTVRWQSRNWSSSPIIAISRLYLLLFLRTPSLGAQTIASLLISGFLLLMAWQVLANHSGPAQSAVATSLREFGQLMAAFNPGMLVLSMCGLHKPHAWMWRTLPISGITQVVGRGLWFLSAALGIGLSWMVGMGLLQTDLMAEHSLEWFALSAMILYFAIFAVLTEQVAPLGSSLDGSTLLLGLIYAFAASLLLAGVRQVVAVGLPGISATAHAVLAAVALAVGGIAFIGCSELRLRKQGIPS